MSDKPKVEIIQPPQQLRDRVALRDKDDVDFSDADAAVNRLAVEFVARLPEELGEIENALTAMEVAPGETAPRLALFRLVHDLKGQAGTFDYLLITVIGNDLCRFLERPIPMSPRCLKVVHFHVDAMKQVAEKKITGDGEGHGLRMVNTLHSMTQKVLQE